MSNKETNKIKKIKNIKKEDILTDLKKYEIKCKFYKPHIPEHIKNSLFEYVTSNFISPDEFSYTVQNDVFTSFGRNDYSYIVTTNNRYSPDVNVNDNEISQNTSIDEPIIFREQVRPNEDELIV